MSSVTYTETNKEGWVNLVLKKKNFCNYPGKCNIDKNISGDLCVYCGHRIPLDIPAMLEDLKRKE